MTQRFCRICKGWHSLEDDWPLVCIGHFGVRSQSGVQIIKDIEPYKAVAVDVATGKAPVVGGRRQHREFLKRNNYIEVGNEKMTQRPIPKDTTVRRDVIRAMQEVKNR